MNGKTIILMLAAAMLLPLHSSAQDKPKVKSVDLTIPVPTPCMTLEDAREFQSEKRQDGVRRPCRHRRHNGQFVGLGRGLRRER
ncbi:MAG: hypothetical protein L6V35_04965 [Alistipes putredinis]|nr:MAG: hypothetical protein L6V35_04965 [Alistipes putredinis]